MQLKEFRLFIDGRYTDSEGAETFASVNPADGSRIAEISQATPADVDRAVEAARRAFSTWSLMSGEQRGGILRRAADILEKRTDEFAMLESQDTGKTRKDTNAIDVPASVAFLRWYGQASLDFQAETIPIGSPNQIDFTLRQPYGVVGLIAPWNFPLLIAILKIGPALAVGNTAVMLPAKQTSITTLRLGEVFEDAGLPEGVLNIVAGVGEVVGEAIVSHPKVSKIFFTGSTRTGKRIMKVASENLTDVAMELGGKSPNIVFADADWKQALSGATYAILFNNGQNCIAGSRLLVQKCIYSKFVTELTERFRAIRLGDPADRSTQLGPLVSREHYERVMSYIDVGRDEGAGVACGGIHPAGEAFAKGYYVEPTLFTDVHNGMRIAQEEIFGPVLAAIPFEDEEQAVAIANDTPYGLGAGVFTTDVNKAHRMIRALECGTVYVNTYNMVYPQAPFPAWKGSGNCVERGRHGLLENTRYKNVIMDISGESIQWG